MTSSSMLRCSALLLFCATGHAADAPRRPAGDAETAYWLTNLARHRFTPAEMSAATGLSEAEVAAALAKLELARPPVRRSPDTPLEVLPYPGGRHPRIGFLEGAVDPQRETKVSVFCPWDDGSYVVVDAPEAVWSNLGLTYLAHTHVPTVWTKQNVAMEPLEWTRRVDGSLFLKRTLPNGIVLASNVVPTPTEVRFELTLTNGTPNRLTDLRVQVCAMLKGAAGFTQQSNDNKQFHGSVAVAGSPDRTKWILMAWEPLHRCWGNAKCPCLHSDPKFPDCESGATVRVRGRLRFHQGADVMPAVASLAAAVGKSIPVAGSVVDPAGAALPCRIYVQSEDGTWHFARTASVDGSAFTYRRQRGSQGKSIEMHTTVSAHPFALDLPPGKYTVTVERGKEWMPVTQTLVVGDAPAELKVTLRRWIDMPSRGWFSGDTHCHRALAEVHNVMRAEDLHVTFPLTAWVTKSHEAPKDPKLSSEPVKVDADRVYHPRSTEYEIFTTNGKSHTLGAVFVIGHKTPLPFGVPPVRPVADRARAEGALLELDKHNWPWSMMIIPVMNVDLFELSNNHVWRTEFGFPGWAEQPPAYMNAERTAEGVTERGWLDFGFQNYYALLNCGLRMRPTAGTASGVHPVPLGFGRVYVHVGERFTYDAWVAGLNAGRSFVTTGPMLLAEVDGKLPGHTFTETDAAPRKRRVGGTALSTVPIDRIEILVNGEVAATVKADNVAKPDGGFQAALDATVETAGSGWIAVRCFEDRPDKRVRFAHTGPVHFDVKGSPVRPRRAEAEYLVGRVEAELKRNAGVLDEASLAEYRLALEFYGAALARAR